MQDSDRALEDSSPATALAVLMERACSQDKTRRHGGVETLQREPAVDRQPPPLALDSQVRSSSGQDSPSLLGWP